MARNVFIEHVIKGLSLIFGSVAGFAALDILHRYIEPQVMSWRGYQAVGGEDLFYAISFALITYIVYKIFCLIFEELLNLYYF